MRYVFILVAVFIGIVWYPVESAWLDFCFNNFDLGIYAQAIQLLSIFDLNPWLSTRDLNLFNDHFDPILFLFAPLRNLAPPALVAIRVEMAALCIAAMAPIWLAYRKDVSWTVGIAACAMLLFSPLTLDAAFYPAHPGTWSVAPLSWMLAFLYLGWDLSALIMFVLVLACKEEYPLVGLLLSASLWKLQRGRSALGFFLVSVVWAVGVFIVRPYLMGPAAIYTDAVSKGAGLELLMTSEGAWQALIRIGSLLLPFLFVTLNRQSLAKDFATKRADFVLALVPISCLVALLSVRIAGGYWGNHRVAPLVAPAVFCFVYVLGRKTLSMRRLVAFFALTLTLAFPSFELGSRVWRGKAFKKHCPVDLQRITALNESMDYIRENDDGPALVQGNLVPSLVDVLGVAQVGATKERGFSYLLIEKESQRNTWPLSQEQFSTLETWWRTSEEKRIVRDDKYVLLMETIR